MGKEVRKIANQRKMDQVLLGLLSHEPLTGYDIKKRLDTTLHFFWGGSYGSIYPTLSDLEKNKKITKKNIIENGRNKIVYNITNKGKICLQKWLNNPVEKDEIRYETLLKLFIGNGAGFDTAMKHIERFEEKCNQELEVLKLYKTDLLNFLGEDDHKYYYLTVLFGITTYESYIKWCKEAKKLLQEWSS